MSQSVQLTQQPAAKAPTKPDIVDGYPRYLYKLGLWPDLHSLRTTRHFSGESLLQSIRRQDGNLALQIGVGKTAVLSLSYRSDSTCQ